MKNQIKNIVDTISTHGGNRFTAVIKETMRVEAKRKIENEMKYNFELNEDIEVAEIKPQVLVRAEPCTIEIENEFNNKRKELKTGQRSKFGLRSEEKELLIIAGENGAYHA